MIKIKGEDYWSVGIRKREGNEVKDLRPRSSNESAAVNNAHLKRVRRLPKIVSKRSPSLLS